MLTMSGATKSSIHSPLRVVVGTTVVEVVTVVVEATVVDVATDVVVVGAAVEVVVSSSAAAVVATVVAGASPAVDGAPVVVVVVDGAVVAAGPVRTSAPGGKAAIVEVLTTSVADEAVVVGSSASTATAMPGGTDAGGANPLESRQTVVSGYSMHPASNQTSAGARPAFLASLIQVSTPPHLLRVEMNSASPSASQSIDSSYALAICDSHALTTSRGRVVGAGVAGVAVLAGAPIVVVAALLRTGLSAVELHATAASPNDRTTPNNLTFRFCH